MGGALTILEIEGYLSHPSRTGGAPSDPAPLVPVLPCPEWEEDEDFDDDELDEEEENEPEKVGA